MSDDFSDHPTSVAEARANKAHDAKLWKPRDALIAALRAIDKGEIAPTSLIVVAAIEHKDDKTTMNYFNAISSTFYGVGMLTAAITDYNKV